MLRRGVRLTTLAACVLTVCPCARAQDAQDPPVQSRAEALEEARRAKAQTLAEPPRPNKLETALDYIEDSRLFPRVFNPPRGWFAQVGGLGEGNGFTMGGGYRHPTGLGVVTVRGLGSMRQSYLGSVDLTRRFLPREAGFVTASVTRRHEAALRYFGAGPDSSEDARSSFGLSAFQAETTAGVRLMSWLTVAGGVGYLAPNITASSEASRVLATEQRFAEVPPPGLRAEPDFFTTHATALVDTRDVPNAHRGGLYQATVRRFSDREAGRGAHSFTSTRIDLQHFVPFWNQSRVLAFRLLTEHTNALGAGEVPFYLQPSLGGSRSLRGYQRQRFRDQNMILFSAEYRYEVNPFLTAAVFYDAGQVASQWSRFRVKDLKDNFGFGMRFGYSSGVALRADIAFGGEDPVRFILGFNSSF